ncbi:MAG: thiopeptide-type bacteriocin biosynthesis protein [Bacteroidales bacterium]
MLDLKIQEDNISRSYIPGDQWVYFKLYCGPKTGDKILVNVIREVSETLLKSQKIHRWFFIRYSDPDFHIRVRFNFTQKEAISDIITMMTESLEYFVKENLVWKVVIDTYQREIERYGLNTMDEAETIFYHDSQMIVDFLEMIEGEDGERYRWLFSLRAMDAILSDFHLDTESKMEVMFRISQSFGKEHNKDEQLARQLSKKFREEKKAIQDILNPEKDEESEMKPALDLIQQKSEKVKEPIKQIIKIRNESKLIVQFDDLISSYLHMFNNRLFRSKNRIHEMVVYDFLFRVLKSRVAREKYAKKG